MARDYKRSTGYKPKTKLPGWLMFVFGLGVGLFAAFLWFLKQHEERSVTASAPHTQTPATTLPDSKDSGAQPPRFDFYTILPEQEVIIPDQELKETKPEKAKREAAKPAVKTAPTATATVDVAPSMPAAKTGGYVLQVGSFKKMEEADRLRAALALIGIESSVQVVRIGDNDSWHRVRIGPFEDLARINTIRAKLKQNNYNSIVLQVKS